MLSDWGYGLQDFGSFPDDTETPEPVRRKCLDCRGTGEIEGDECESCRGYGYILEDETDVTGQEA